MYNLLFLQAYSCIFVGLAYRECEAESTWSDIIDTRNCRNVELIVLNDRAVQLADTLRDITGTDTMDLTVYFDIDEVQEVSGELTVLTNTSETSLVPNDINTTNNVLSTLIR